MTLDATGLTIKTAAEIEDEVSVDQRAALGDQLVTGPESPLGQLNSIFAAQLATAWTLLQQVFEALDPDAAEGTQLDTVCSLAPLTRNPATKSVGVLTINGLDTTVIPIGYIVRIPLGARFVTTAAAVIPFAATIDVAIESEEYGEIEGLSGTITEPVTIIAGVTSITNAADVVEGRLVESDSDLRQRREGSLSVAGSCTDASVAARIGELDTVEQSLVISNRTNAVDAFSIPPKSGRAIVYPAQAASQPVWDQIWLHWPIGITSDGAITGTAQDQQGNSQPVAFSVATEIEVHIAIALTVDTVTYSGDAAVIAAVAAATANPLIGADLLLWTIENRVGDDVTGILTIEARALVGSTPTSLDTANIAIDLDEIGLVDSGDITVVIL